jgi:chromosome segregation ATPase
MPRKTMRKTIKMKKGGVKGNKTLKNLQEKYEKMKPEYEKLREEYHKCKEELQMVRTVYEKIEEKYKEPKMDLIIHDKKEEKLGKALEKYSAKINNIKDDIREME